MFNLEIKPSLIILMLVLSCLLLYFMGHNDLTFESRQGFKADTGTWNGGFSVGVLVQDRDVIQSLRNAAALQQAEELRRRAAEQSTAGLE